MHKAILIAVAIALLSATSAQASTTARDPRVPALQRTVAALSAKVLALQAQVDQNANALNHEIDLGTCRFVYQSHFNFVVLNVFATIIGSGGYPDSTPSDAGACSRVGITPPRFLAAVERSPFATLPYLLSAMTR